MKRKWAGVIYWFMFTIPMMMMNVIGLIWAWVILGDQLSDWLLKVLPRTFFTCGIFFIFGLFTTARIARVSSRLNWTAVRKVLLIAIALGGVGIISNLLPVFFEPSIRTATRLFVLGAVFTALLLAITLRVAIKCMRR